MSLNQQNKLLSLIGLATRARKTASGEFATEKAVKSGHAFVVIIAADASDNTKKKFSNMCTYYKVPLYFFGTKDTLGQCMGKEIRASIAIIDDGFAKAMIEQLETMQQN